MENQKTPTLLNIECDKLISEISSMSNTGGWIYDVENEKLEWTAETYRIYGLEVGIPIDADMGIKHYPGESKKFITELFENAINHGEGYQEELPFVDALGNEKWIRTTGKVLAQEGRVTHVYGAFEDITKEKHQIALEKDATFYLETIINNLNDAVLTVDENGSIISANQTTEQIFRCKITDLIGQNVTVLMHDSHAGFHNKYMEQYLLTGDSRLLGVDRELQAMRFNGEEFPMEITLTEMIRKDRRVFVGIIRDISEKKAATSKIYQLAYFDTLTKLPNRRSFEKDLAEVISKAKLASNDVYCALLDIVNFSEINLIYGKRAGDRLLSTVAAAIQEQLPTNFRLYRNMADSFFLLHLLPISNKAENILQKIKKAEQLIQELVAREVTIGPKRQPLNLSIGSLCIPTSEIDNEKLVQLLEFSSYQAKSEELSKNFMLDKTARESYERQAQMRHSMLHGLENDEFHIVLQPQYTLSGVLIASEALLRWNSKTLGAVSPVEFISLAEENGDILVIGDWVINEVCKLISQLEKQGITTRVSINISAKQIVQPDFAYKLMFRLKQWSVSPSRLMLEITESTLVQNIELVRNQMLELSKQGLSFSIDDFGTGYSSLRYLKELPINELKIDRYFVEEITKEEHEVAIVNTIIEMAKALGVETVAEGIENEQQLRYLARKGCNYFQGFYFSKPLTVEKWLELFDENKTVELAV